VSKERSYWGWKRRSRAGTGGEKGVSKGPSIKKTAPDSVLKGGITPTRESNILLVGVHFPSARSENQGGLSRKCRERRKGGLQSADILVTLVKERKKVDVLVNLNWGQTQKNKSKR